MGITDTILGFMRLNDDDDDDKYDSNYDMEDEYDTKRTSRKAFSKKYDDDEDDEVKEIKATSKPKAVKSKVVPMRGKNGMEVCVIRPSTIEDGGEITNTLVSGRAVILNLEGIHVELAQRIIDFTSGSCFAIDGNLQKVSNYIFIATPPTVEISGDFQEILNGNASVYEM